MNILIAGDYCPQERVTTIIKDRESRGEVLRDLSDEIHGADYSIVNFECAVVGDDKKGYQPIEKFGPCLSCTPESVEVLSEAGFKCVTLANNHFRDYGNVGCEATISCLKSAAIDYVGGGINIDEARHTLHVNIKGKRLAIINACEYEFSIASKKRAGAAPLEIIDVCNQIHSAKHQSDYVIVILHGGHEHYQLPSPRMVKTYRFFVDQGADVVINHHQHCYSGYEIYNGHPIFYGLGNFLFDWKGKRNTEWNEGYALMMNLDECIEFELLPYTQCNDRAVVKQMNDKEKKRFFERIAELNEIIKDEEKLKSHFDKFCEQRKRSIIVPFTPYLNKYARIVAGRHWLPYFLPKNKVLAEINFIECEAHRDVLLNTFHKMTET